MSGLIGAVARGLGDAAGKASDIATGYIDDERKVDVQAQLMKLEEEKLLRIDDIKRNRDYASDVKRSDPTGELKINERKNSSLDSQQATQNSIDRNNNAQYLAGERKKAQSTYIESSASAASAANSRYDLEKKRQTDTLIADIDAAAEAGDVKKVERLTNRLNLVNGNKYGQRYDKAIVEDANGNKNVVVVDKVNGTISQPEVRRPGTSESNDPWTQNWKKPK